MLITDKGIILSKLKYSDNTVIVKVLTLDRGIRTYLASGVNAPKSKLKNQLLEPLTLVEFSAYDSPAKEMNRLKEVRLLQVHAMADTGFEVIAVKQFIAEIIVKALKEGDTGKEVFGFLSTCLALLEANLVRTVNFPQVFMVNLAAYLGFAPEAPERSAAAEVPLYFDLPSGKFSEFPGPADLSMNEEESRYLLRIITSEFSEALNMSIPKPVRISMLDKLVRFYGIHIADFNQINSVSILHQLSQ